MAKTKEIDLEGSDGEDSKVELTEEEIEFEAVLEELGPSVVKWHITCISPPNKAGYVATWQSGEEISLDRIAREFGAGEYKIRPIGARGRIVPGGRNVKVSNNAAYERERAKAATTPAGPTATQPQTIGIGEIIALMQSSQANTMTMMQAMMQSQTSLLTAMVSRPLPEPREGLGAPELVSMMESMKSMVTPEGSGAAEMLLKGVELARALESGGGEGGTDFMTLAAKSLDVVASAIKSDASAPPRKVQVRQVRTEPARPAKPATAPPSQPKPAPNPAPETGEQSMLKWLKAQVNALLHQAKRDSNPALYAAVLLDNLPDGITDDVIRSNFGDPTSVAKLAFINPEVSNHSAWFEEFRKAVIEQLDAEDAEDDAEDVELEGSEAGSGDGD